MTNIIKTTLLSIATLSLAVGLMPGVKVSAQAEVPFNVSDQLVVRATKGLNIRDKNCNYITTLPYGSIATPAIATIGTEANQIGSISCTINGKQYIMVEVETTAPSNAGGRGYAAVDWVKQLSFVANSQNLTFGHIVDASIGLNVRDAQCNKIGAVANNANAQFINDSGSESATRFNNLYCEVNGQVYAMTQYYFPSINKRGYIATAFLQTTDSASNTVAQTSPLLSSLQLDGYVAIGNQNYELYMKDNQGKLYSLVVKEYSDLYLSIVDEANKGNRNPNISIEGSYSTTNATTQYIESNQDQIDFEITHFTSFEIE
jgi:hypothetical protein